MMFTEEIRDTDLEMLALAVDEFTNDKILLDVRYENIGAEWVALITFIPLF